MRTSAKAAPEIFKEVRVQKTSDIIISRIRELIKNGVLRPGEKLPSERELAERFKVGRGPLRDALKKLEFYGILKSIPFKGTYIAAMKEGTLSGLIGNLLEISDLDFESMMETRSIIEVFSAALAAQRASAEEKARILERHEIFKAKLHAGKTPDDEDFLFHMQIAYATENDLIKSLISVFTPALVSLSKSNQDREKAEQRDKLKEHQDIVDKIFESDAKGAFRAMKFHLEQAFWYRFGKKLTIFDVLS
ncbi:MAG: GntR family transcriptional regulator [Spirochaetales bacterium]|jgi:GntR family transcriptional repressor for pyruvate dehydrogenase complex|nr:GntR family transcriptional regulator [Spirochaetales bacterium]